MSTDIADKIDQHFSRYKMRRYKKGQILVLGGDEPQYIYYVKSGKVRQYGISYRGDEIVLNVFKKGAFFPLLSFVARLPNRYFFRAETDIEVHLALPAETDVFLKTNPDVMYDLLTRLYTGMDGIMRRMFYLMAGSAKDRLLYELLIECRRFGEPRDGGSQFVATHVSDIAARAGLSRETASREMQKLSGRGLVRVDSKGITVTNIKELEETLGSEL